MSMRRSQTGMLQKNVYIKLDDVIDLADCVLASLSPEADPQAFYNVLLLCLPDLKRIEIDEA